MEFQGQDHQPFVWVTRPLPQADDHAGALAAAGFRPLLSPVISIKPLPVPDRPPLPPVETSGLIFTSVNGLLHFPKHWMADYVAHPVFVSGTTTQNLARDMGFQKVLCSDHQGSRGMVALVRDELPRRLGASPSNLLYLAGRSRTPILEEALSQDFDLTLSELYEAEFEHQLSDAAREAFENQQIVATTLFSSRSAMQAATLLQSHFGGSAKQVQDQLLTVCISQAVADRARQSGFNRIAVATMESSDSVVDKLVKQLNIHRKSSNSI
ncbi:uroporphyrinogen-III synthase [Pararhizobium sp. IMCC21322]|uniref:uroporphyrinogen-III synthase n=1 Tax=Pararhizobium sp. IMCC21322 TaxID=3067903 RepID=UPI002740CEC0|nr:uroporphyrinogen-III synthase [Pararhizobium sp. IMCC21322]